MGLEFIDIVLTVEREFDVSIPIRELESELLRRIGLAETLARKSGERVLRDVNAQQLFDEVCIRIYYEHGRVPDDAWPRFVQCICEVIGVDSTEIVPTAYLVSDLGI